MKLINIQNREQFDEMLDQLGKAKIVVADTEANGLKHYRQNYVISISLYLPEFDTAWNIPYRHGDGQINIRYTAKNSPDIPFNKLTWQGNTKSDIYLSYWFAKYKPLVDFKNIPEEWIQELKDNWALKGVTYMFHHARFDLHMLRAEGFPTPEKVLDTLLLLHTVNEDWKNIKIEAPFTNKEGMWALSEDGTPLKKKQAANRRLKWQAMLWGLKDAHVGETQLHLAKGDFEVELATFITQGNLDDPMNKGLVYAAYKNSDTTQGINPKKPYKVSQLDKVAKKLTLSAKAHMWMLPSDRVAHYAMMDTVLTYQLYEKLFPIIEKWDNVELYYNLCDIQLNVAWVMECNGMKLDVDEARKQVAKHTPQYEKIQDTINLWSKNLGYTEGVNISSPKQLLPFLQETLKHEFPMDLMPDFIEGTQIAEMENVALERVTLNATGKEDLEPYKYHPIVQLVLEFRKLKKTVNTYLTKWLLVKDADNIVRGSMNPDGTVAGRFSSSGESGNMQNIPDRGGYNIKTAFIPYSDEWIIFAIDYGQLEARVAAWIAELLLPELGVYSIDTPVMVDLFNEGADMHSYVRDIVGVRDVLYTGMSDAEIGVAVGIDPSSMSEEDLAEYVAHKVCRQVAKTLNFGLLYSGTHKMVSKLLHVPENRAKELVDKWRSLFPAFALAQKYYESEGLTWKPTPSGNGRGMYVTQPITGRHRKLQMYDTFAIARDGRPFNPRKASARKLWNNVVQGLSGWMSVDSALRYQNDHTWEGMRLFAQIHDSLDGCNRKDSLHRVKTLMSYMVDYPTNPVLTVDLEAGYNFQPASVNNPKGLRTVHNIDLWIESNGVQGYE